MTPKRRVLLDPHFRRLNEIFEPADLERLHGLADVVWARDEPMPAAAFDQVKGDLWAVIAPEWRYGPLEALPNLRAILDVGGRLPSPASLDYAACFARGIRVLTCAPAFGPMVAEMALGMVLAATREIVDGHNAFVAGREQYYWHGNWPFNTAYAAAQGLEGYVVRFTSLAQAEPWIAAGVPVVMSYPWKKGSLAGAPIASSNGHLAVLVGFDSAGNPVMNDPAAATDDEVQRTYDREELETVWLENSGGTVYLIYPPDHNVPSL